VDKYEVLRVFLGSNQEYIGKADPGWRMSRLDYIELDDVCFLVWILFPPPGPGGKFTYFAEAFPLAGMMSTKMRIYLQSVAINEVRSQDALYTLYLERLTGLDLHSKTQTTQ